VNLLTSPQDAQKFVLQILFGDMLLNWLLGAALVLLPARVDGVLGRAPLLPPALYQAIGAIFLAFAAWQLRVATRRTIGPPGLVFAALMALIPVILLTVALLFMDFPLRSVWRAVLWVGDIYMFILGGFYLWVAHLLAR